MLGAKRASRACVRRSSDIVFPKEVSFPLRQKLTIQGAFSDTTMPQPLADIPGADAEDDHQWRVAIDETEEQDGVEPLAYADGQWGENAPRYDPEPIGIMEAIAIQPDNEDALGDSQAEDEEVLPAGGVLRVNADIADEIARIQAIQQEVVHQDGAPPVGWRIDTFPRGDAQRHVSTPPWSQRPPNVEPEVWLGIDKRVRRQLREEWKSKDPSGSARQETRRQIWQDAKNAGHVPRVMVARLVASQHAPAGTLGAESSTVASCPPENNNSGGHVDNRRTSSEDIGGVAHRDHTTIDAQSGSPSFRQSCAGTADRVSAAR